MSLFASLEAFITTHVWPFLKNIGKAAVNAEINALQPLAVQAVADAQHAIVSAAASGSVASLGSVLSDILVSTAAKAEATAISAGATSLLASVGTALATNTVTATSLAVAPKP